jgi:hypothetical protein
MHGDARNNIAEPFERVHFEQFAGGHKASWNRHSRSAAITTKECVHWMRDRGQLRFSRGQLKLPKAGNASAIQVGDDLYGERSASKMILAAVRAEVGVGDCRGESGHGAETARKYLRDRRLPNEMRQKHTWRTRPDPFADSWDEIRQLIAVEPGLQAKTIFEHLQQAHPGRFSDGQGGHCGAGLVIGELRKGRRERCSLRKRIGRTNCANRTSRTAGNCA